MSKLFKELMDLKKSYDDKLRQGGEEALKESFKELFEAHPRLRSVVWAQYTPYFNDGDPCYFRVGEFDVHVEGVPNEEYGDEDHTYCYGESLYSLRKSKDEEVKSLVVAVQALAGEIPDDVLESVFGDHCRVVATRKGFDVREHKHD